MPWTPEQRRQYAPAISDAVRANATDRLATMIDAIDPPARTGRPRLWSTLVMLQALWWLCRAGAAWALLPSSCPPRQTIGSRLERWVRLGVLDRALAVLTSGMPVSSTAHPLTSSSPRGAGRARTWCAPVKAARRVAPSGGFNAKCDRWGVG